MRFFKQNISVSVICLSAQSVTYLVLTKLNLRMQQGKNPEVPI